MTAPARAPITSNKVIRSSNVNEPHFSHIRIPQESTVGNVHATQRYTSHPNLFYFDMATFSRAY